MTLKEQINDLVINFNLAKEGYKKAFIEQAGLSNQSTDNNLLSASARLNSVLKDMYLLGANINEKIEANKNNIVEGDAQISDDQTKYYAAKKVLGNQYNVNLAAEPLKIDEYNKKNSTFLIAFSYSLGIFLLCVLIYRQFKSDDINYLAEKLQKAKNRMANEMTKLKRQESKVSKVAAGIKDKMKTDIAKRQRLLNTLGPN